jgi:hypothetical protein
LGKGGLEECCDISDVQRLLKLLMRQKSPFRRDTGRTRKISNCHSCDLEQSKVKAIKFGLVVTSSEKA